MRNVIPVAACAILVCVFAGAAHARDAFDGKWEVTITPDSGGKERKDTLTFAGEKITSEFTKKEGYPPASYEADVRGGQIATFTATQEGKAGAKAKWTGTAAATSIEGTLVVTNDKGESTSYTYKGQRAEK